MTPYNQYIEKSEHDVTYHSQSMICCPDQVCLLSRVAVHFVCNIFHEFIFLMVLVLYYLRFVISHSGFLNSKVCFISYMVFHNYYFHQLAFVNLLFLFYFFLFTFYFFYFFIFLFFIFI